MSESLLDKAERLAGELIIMYPALQDAMERDKFSGNGGGGRTKSVAPPLPFNADVLTVADFVNEKIRASYEMAVYELGERLTPRDLTSMTYALPGLSVRLVSARKPDRADDVVGDLNVVHRRVRKVLGIAFKTYDLNAECIICHEGRLKAGTKELPVLNMYRDRNGTPRKINGAEESIEWTSAPIEAYCTACNFTCSFDSFEWLSDQINESVIREAS